MIKIDFVEPNTESWRRWKRQSEVLTEILLDDHDPGMFHAGSPKPKIEFKSHYAKTKLELAAAFKYKCAFCESSLRRFQIDVEHYRPKGGVTKLDFSAVEGHPGYFWLAYHVSNLMPACQLCNQSSRREGRRIGKVDRFPVKDDCHAWRPDQIETEEPLLLDPRADDPGLHLDFDRETGRFLPKTERGRVTIEILGLNLDDLATARKKVYLDVLCFLSALESAAGWQGGEVLLEHASQQIAKFRDGDAEYALAGRAAIWDWGKRRRVR